MRKMSKMKRWLLVAGIFACLAIATQIYRYRAVRVGEELEYAIARMPIGITAAEADQLVGGLPDRTSQQSGVLMNTVTFLTESNSLAAQYGEPQEYDFRLWTRGNVKAAVVVDADGYVAGHYTWR